MQRVTWVEMLRRFAKHDFHRSCNSFSRSPDASQSIWTRSAMKKSPKSFGKCVGNGERCDEPLISGCHWLDWLWSVAGKWLESVRAVWPLPGPLSRIRGSIVQTVWDLHDCREIRSFWWYQFGSASLAETLNASSSAFPCQPTLSLRTIVWSFPDDCTFLLYRRVSFCPFRWWNSKSTTSWHPDSTAPRFYSFWRQQQHIDLFWLWCYCIDSDTASDPNAFSRSTSSAHVKMESCRVRTRHSTKSNGRQLVLLGNGEWKRHSCPTAPSSISLTFIVFNVKRMRDLRLIALM